MSAQAVGTIVDPKSHSAIVEKNREAFRAERAGLDAAMQRSLVQGDSNDPCWRIEDQLLIRACDQLRRRGEDLDAVVGPELAAVEPGVLDDVVAGRFGEAKGF